MSTEIEILKKKATWVILNKLRIGEDDIVIEASMTFHDENRYEVEAILSSKAKRKAVTASKALANAILSALAIIQLRGIDDTDKT